VLADPRARTPRRRGSAAAVERTFYRLAYEPREVIFVACSKCEWKAAFRRDELITAHGAACPMPSLLEHLAAPGCARIGPTRARRLTMTGFLLKRALPCANSVKLLLSRAVRCSRHAPVRLSFALCAAAGTALQAHFADAH
jgi:hypothetical protein